MIQERSAGATEQVKLAVQTALQKPGMLIKWMELLDGAERVGRIKRAKMSVLRYGIQRYIQSRLPEIDMRFRVRLEPMDDCIEITCKDPAVPKAADDWEVTVDYPDWLVNFLDDDERFTLMLPGCPEKLGEVLQQIYEYCAEQYPDLME